MVNRGEEKVRVHINVVPGNATGIMHALHVYVLKTCEINWSAVNQIVFLEEAASILFFTNFAVDF